MRTPSPARPSIEVDAPTTASQGDGPAPDADRFAGPPDGGVPESRPEDGGGLWFAAAALWRRRWVVVLLTLLAAGGGVWLGLSLPKWYSAETRVFLPEQGGSSMSALIETVAPGAGALLGGGGGGDYTRYLAILTSRTVMDRVVDRFDLVERYETVDKPDPRGAALLMLATNATFEVSLEYNYLAVHVLDKDPQTSAAMANFFVAELNKENTRLTSENAREQRAFVETRLAEAEAELQGAQANLQVLQERYGVSEPTAQGEAVFAAIGEASAAVAQAEVQYRALQSELGDENPQTVAARVAYETARAQLESLSSGGSALLPVPLRELPQVGRQYAQARQEIILQAKIIEYVRPMYEQARFDERRETSAVQVLDAAVAPVRKAKPKVAFVAAGVTVSVFVLLCVWIVGVAALKRSAPTIARRLRENAPGASARGVSAPGVSAPGVSAPGVSAPGERP